MSKLAFTKDIHGQEILLKEGKFQVMMEWEKPYMKACIDALKPCGDVLEIGFGCGYSAEYIQEYNPTTHTIIECDEVVLQRAKKWAIGKPSVRILDGTWQDLLGQLGHFDAIFFDDYPLESQSQVETLDQDKKEASWLMRKGETFLQKIKAKFSFLETLQYKEEDLEQFFQQLNKKKKPDQHHFLPFFLGLKKRGQITAGQFDLVVDRLIKEQWIDEAVKNNFFLENPQDKKGFSFNKRGDRFFEFLEKCLNQHMKEGSRFSCYLEESHSRYEEPEFVEKIILNPHLDFQEHVIDVDVPENCLYFKGSQALVIVITKR